MADSTLVLTYPRRGNHYYTFTNLKTISRHFKQHYKPMIVWILQVYDKGGQALSLNSEELVILGRLTGDTLFNCYCQTLQGGCQLLLTWLVRAWCLQDAPVALGHPGGRHVAGA
ncbi:uncharacterized protein PS065_008193 [Dugong dugon]